LGAFSRMLSEFLLMSTKYKCKSFFAPFSYSHLYILLRNFLCLFKHIWVFLWISCPWCFRFTYTCTWLTLRGTQRASDWALPSYTSGKNNARKPFIRILKRQYKSWTFTLRLSIVLNFRCKGVENGYVKTRILFWKMFSFYLHLYLVDIKRNSESIRLNAPKLHFR
jgi:hypothetical protein